MWIRTCAALVLVTSLLAQGFCGDDVSAVLAGLKKRYSGAEAMAVPYSREVISRTMAMLPGNVKGDMASGMLYFKPPYYMRMEQERPDRETLLSDGERIWWHVPAKNLVQVYPFKKFGKEFLLLSDILRGLSDVAERFSTSLLQPEGDDGSTLLELRPEPPWEEMDKIVLKTTKDFRISTVIIHNKIGGITRFELGEAGLAQALPPDLFTFTPPPGCKVVEESNQ